MHNIEIDKARAVIYNLLSLLFVEGFAKNRSSEIVNLLEILASNPFNEVVETASKNILEYLKNNGEDSIYKEYQELFLIPFGDFVSLSISLYHEQREGGIMQLKVKDILAKTTIRRDEKSFTAQEDHFGFVFTLCSYLIAQKVDNNLKEDLQKELFIEVLQPYLSKLFFRLMATKSEIYSQVALILESFYNFEMGYLDLN